MIELNTYLQKTLTQKMKSTQGHRNLSGAKDYKAYMKGYNQAITEILGMVNNYNVLANKEEPEQTQLF